MKQNNLKIIDTILFLKKFYEHLKKIIYKNTFLIKGLSLKTRIYKFQNGMCKGYLYTYHLLANHWDVQTFKSLVYSTSYMNLCYEFYPVIYVLI